MPLPLLCLLFCIVKWPGMAINVSVQYKCYGTIFLQPTKQQSSPRTD